MDFSPFRRPPPEPSEPLVPDLSDGAEAGLYLALFELVEEGLIITSDETILEVNSAACELLQRSYPQLVGRPLAELFPSEAAFLSARATLFVEGASRGSLLLGMPDGERRRLRCLAAARVRPGVHALVLSPDLGALPEPFVEAPPRDNIWPRLAAAVKQAVLVVDQLGRISAANAAAQATLSRERTPLVGYSLASLKLEERNLRRLPGPQDGWEILIVGNGEPMSRSNDPATSHYRRIFEHSPLPTLLCSRNGWRIVDANFAAEAAYGYSLDEFRKLTLDDLRPVDRSHEGERRSHIAEGIWKHRRKDGTLFQAEIFSNSIEAGEHASHVLIAHELPPTPNEGPRLKLSSEIFDASSQAILITDADNLIVAVNTAFSKITGYAKHEVLGKTPQILSSGRHDADFYRQMWATIGNEDAWQGEIWNRRKNGDIYPEWLSITRVANLRGETLHYVAMFSDMTERKRLDAQLEYLTKYDKLTGLPNRQLLESYYADFVAHARRMRQQLLLMLVDIDHFKNINDGLGRSTGDALLREVAARICDALPQDTVVARQGGDEFLVLAPQPATPADPAHIAKLLRDAFSRPFGPDGRELTLAASIGIALFPDDGVDLDILIRNAEAAMYQAKRDGRNSYHFYTDDLNTSAFERLAYESSLRRGLPNKEMLLYWQPQFDLESGRLIGAEALMRWQHPDLGLVAPGRFIPIAEESGLIVQLGSWALEEACRQMRAWRLRFGCDIHVAVNISSLQFRQNDFLASVKGVLEQTGLPATALELEMTETVVMHDDHAATLALFALQELGVKLAIDDFGTGYSSLAYLRRFPIHTLKIDRSFVHEIGRSDDGEAIVSAILSLAGSLRLKVVAEGVETQAQQDYLRAAGCDAVQGFLLGRPMPASEFSLLLERTNDASDRRG